MNDLDEMLLDFDNPGEVMHRDGWRIDDMDTAAWASRKAAAAIQSIKRIDAWRQRQMDRIMEVSQQELARHEKDYGFFTDHLGDYLHRLVLDGRKTKTLNLPGGDVAVRTNPSKVQVASGQAVEWAEKNGVTNVLRVKTELDKRAFDKGVTMAEGGTVVWTETGELLDFATWEPGQQNVLFHEADKVSAEENDE